MAIGYFRCEERQNNSLEQYKYNTRTGKYSEKGKEDLVCSGNSNMPAWAKDDPAKFWEANDKFERGTKGKTIIIALPNEMNTDELERLMKKTVDKLFPNHVVSWSIHNSVGPSGQRNKHAHVQVCERLIDRSRPEPLPEQYFKKTRTRKDGTVSGGYKKDTAMTGKDRQKWLDRSKKMWVNLCNEEIRKMENAWYRSRPKEIEIKKSAKKSVHFPRRTWMAALRNTQRKDNFLRLQMDQKLYPILKKRQIEVEKAKDRWTPQATAGDKITALVWHPLNKQKRNQMVWVYRRSRMNEYDRYAIDSDITNINDKYGADLKKLQADRSLHLKMYANNLDIKPPVIESKYKTVVTKIVEDHNRLELERHDMEIYQEEKRKEKEKRKKLEAEEKRRKAEQAKRERIEQEKQKRKACDDEIRRQEESRKEFDRMFGNQRSKGRGRSR